MCSIVRRPHRRNPRGQRTIDPAGARGRVMQPAHGDVYCASASHRSAFVTVLIRVAAWAILERRECAPLSGRSGRSGAARARASCSGVAQRVAQRAAQRACQGAAQRAASASLARSWGADRNACLARAGTEGSRDWNVHGHLRFAGHLGAELMMTARPGRPILSQRHLH